MSAFLLAVNKVFWLPWRRLPAVMSTDLVSHWSSFTARLQCRLRPCALSHKLMVKFPKSTDSVCGPESLKRRPRLLNETGDIGFCLTAFVEIQQQVKKYIKKIQFNLSHSFFGCPCPAQFPCKAVAADSQCCTSCNLTLCYTLSKVLRSKTGHIKGDEVIVTYHRPAARLPRLPAHL